MEKKKKKKNDAGRLMEAEGRMEAVIWDENVLGNRGIMTPRREEKSSHEEYSWNGQMLETRFLDISHVRSGLRVVEMTG